MLGWLIAAIAMTAAIVIVVQYLDKEVAKTKIKETFGDTLGAVVKKVNKGETGVRVTFKDLLSENEMVIETEEVDDSILESDCIFI